MSIVVAKVNIGLVADRCVVQAIIDTEGDKVDILPLDRAGLNRRILGLEI